MTAAHAVPSVPGYDIDRRLGTGSCGSVWRATARDSGVPVALKLIPLGRAAAGREFAAEVSALRVLDHPNLIRLHEVVQLPGAAALVLDLAGAGSLADVLRVRGRLTPGEVITALGPVAAALASVHTAGLVHGDVSAANVLFTDEARPMLADLGMRNLAAAHLEDAPDDASPAAGEIAVRATPAYVDPHVAGGAMPGRASDVFALGAVAFHALTGQTLWPPGEPDEVFDTAALGLRPRDVAARLAAADVPQAVADVVLRALANEPELRAGAADFALDLRFADRPTRLEVRAGRIEPAPAADPVAAALTHGVRLRSPLVPEPAARGWRHRTIRARSASPRRRTGGRIGRRARRGSRWSVSRGGRVLMLLGAALCGLALIVAAARQPHEPDSVASSPASPVSPVSPASAARSEHPGQAPANQAPRAGSTAAEVRGVLQALDALREHAYAERDPALLAQVYAGADLIEADAALLRRLVPPGCGLLGVHTDYSAPVLDPATDARENAAELRLTVVATLYAATLRCAGTDTAVTAGSGPAPISMVLRRGTTHPGEYRIAEVHR